MIQIQTLEVSGFASALHGMRNPMNSWHLQDSTYDAGHDDVIDFAVGPNDLKLATNLSKSGPTHAKYRRMICVYVDITAPLYWWKEFDTYKVGTVANSCSTMHKIHEKEFSIDDFSHEHLIGPGASGANSFFGFTPMELLQSTVTVLNEARMNYLYCKKTNDSERQKLYWWQMIQLLPSTYNQSRTVMMNYEVLANIYQTRKVHKLDEWQAFIEWVLTLPYPELFTASASKAEK